MMNIAYDIIVVAILLLSAFFGYKKGLILTLCGFLSLFVAFFGAAYLANQLDAPVGELFRPAIEDTMVNALTDGESTEELMFSLDEIIESIQDIPLLGGFSDTLKDSIAPENISDALLSVSTAIATKIAYVVIFILAFLLVTMAWMIASRVMDLACRLPVLSTLNVWSGLLLGLVRGMLLVYLGVWLLKAGLLPAVDIAQTNILHFFYENNPLDLLTQLVNSDPVSLFITSSY